MVQLLGFNLLNDNVSTTDLGDSKCRKLLLTINLVDVWALKVGWVYCQVWCCLRRGNPNYYTS
jgi:hypothetical protein